ncbi:MAG: hypothetical protein CM15mP109_07970 [Candidatus Dadabacteria bacterium]|nr:MAG: hypothetical protein CM15mP109_07970 [Candidatus Dadabacteria bacterium]
MIQCFFFGVGFGKILLKKRINFVYEKKFKNIPSMATVIAWGAGHRGKVV